MPSCGQLVETRSDVLVACFNEFERILRFASVATIGAGGDHGWEETLIRKGKGPARRLLKARILLKADVSEAGEGWSDSRIIAALDTSASMVYRVRGNWWKKASRRY